MSLPDELQGKGARLVAVILLAIGIGAIVVAVIRDDEPGASPDRASPTVSEAALDGLRESANPEQLAMLEDGKVSFDEYERAALTYVACLQDAGIEVEVAELRYRGTYYEIRPVIPGNRVDQLDPLRLQCLQQYLVIYDPWAYQHMPTEQETRAARVAFIDCLRSAGINVEDGAPEANTAAYSMDKRYLSCAEEIGEEFAMPGYSG